MNKKQFLAMSDTVLTVALLAVGAFAIGLAMVPDHHIEKAIVLAWLLFP